MNRLTDQLKEIYPFQIKAIIDGVFVVYYSEIKAFLYQNKLYEVELGEKVYHPVRGYLTLTTIQFEALNYKRSQNHLDLFQTVKEAVEWLLETQQQMHSLTFIAFNLMSSYSAEKTLELLKKKKYKTIKDYAPQTLEAASLFLEKYSKCKNHLERAYCFQLNQPYLFEAILLCGDNQTYLFKNEHLAIAPIVLSTHDTANAKGEIMRTFTFEPIEILNQRFTQFIKPVGELDCLTLINNKLYDLTKDETKEVLVHCPTCGTLLSNEKCDNYYCKTKVISRAYYLASKDGMAITGLSHRTLELMYDYLRKTLTLKEHLITDAFFFSFDKHTIEAIGIKPQQAAMLEKAINQAKESQKLSCIINGLKIDYIDKILANKISAICHHDINKLITLLKDKPEALNIKNAKEKVNTLNQINHFIQKIQ